MRTFERPTLTPGKGRATLRSIRGNSRNSPKGSDRVKGPNTKLQTAENLQVSSSKSQIQEQRLRRECWDLGVGVSLEFGVWDLGFRQPEVALGANEPTPARCQEGNLRDLDKRLLPSWEGSGMGRFLCWGTRAFLGCALLVAVTAVAQEPPVETKEKPRIEVCFVLDTTGSMTGLIEGAKQKIWSIANEMTGARPTPD